MGRKVSDGKTFNATVPGGDAVSDYELYRISGQNGLAIGEVAVGDTDRTLAFERDKNFEYSIHVPAGVNPDPGDFLYWASPLTSFQAGPTNLRSTPATMGDAPCFFVTQARTSDGDGGYVLRGQVLNGVTGTGSLS